MEKPYEDDFVRPDLKEFGSYNAHTSPDTLKQRFGLSLDEIIKLDANENPFGCLPAVTQALAGCKNYSIYPDAGQTKLRNAIALYAGVEPERIVAGAGSDQLIDLLLRLTVRPGDEIINLPPTFGMYSFYARLSGARVIEVERDPDFGIDADAVEKQITPKTRMVFIANPNNPSGNLCSRGQIKQLLESGRTIVVDEAYYEFSRETVADWVGSYPNLIILRTFSKWAGLAGLRIGYGIFDSGTAAYLMRIKDPYNINTAAQTAALAALAHKAELYVQVKTILYEKERLFNHLAGIDGIQPYPSTANFILCSCISCDAPEIVAELKNRGILVRYFDHPRLKNFIRISVGKPEHNDILVETLKEILGEGNSW